MLLNASPERYAILTVVLFYCIAPLPLHCCVANNCLQLSFLLCVCVCSCVVSWSQFHNFVMFLCSVRYRRASWKPGRFILAYYCAKLLSCFIEYSALIRVVTRNAMHYNFNKNLHDSSIYLHAFVCRSLIHSWLLSSREHISEIAELTSRIKWVLSHSNCRKMRAFSNGYNSD